MVLKMSKSKIIKIIINCEENELWKDEIKTFPDSPKWLGFDFCVKETEKDKMINFIKDMLNKYNVPLFSISTVDLNIKLWNKKEIEKEIKKGYK
jgi:hypothetical protein